MSAPTVNGGPWQGAFSANERDRAALTALVRELRQTFALLVAVEIGSWTGATARAILDGGADTLYCVDTWDGSDHEFDPVRPLVRMLGGTDVVYAEFAKTMGPDLGKRVTPLYGLSAEVARTWTDRVHLVFIDGDHHYASVRGDIEAWTRHIIPGGVLCGHDFGSEDWPGVAEAVRDTGPYEVVGDSVWVRRL